MGFPNPIGWIGSELSSGTKALLGWLTDAVNFVEGEVNQLWDNTVKWVNGVYDWTSREISSAYSTVSRWIGDVYTFVGHQADIIFNWTIGEINAVISDIGSVYNTVASWVNDAISFAESLPYHVEQWVITNIWDPIQSFFVAVYHDVAGWIDDAIKWVTDNVWNPLVGFYHDIVNWVKDAVNWVDAFGLWAWHLLKGAEHWLVLIAKWSYSDAVTFWNLLTHPSARNLIAWGESEAEPIIQGIEDVVSRWLEQ